MADINEIIDVIERLAPLDTQEEWDNSGWQIGPFKSEIKKILLTLDVNENSVQQAVENGCDLIISHHPVFFSSIKSLKPSYITKAIKYEIAIYSAHTNLDIAQDGLNDYFANVCGFSKLENINTFVKYQQLNSPYDLKLFLSNLKKIFGVEVLKVVNLNKANFTSIAFCSGSGGEFIELVDSEKIDVYLTGDVKYHQAQMAEHTTVIDVGHFNSEICSVELFKKLLANINAEIIVSKGKDAFEYI